MRYVLLSLSLLALFLSPLAIAPEWALGQQVQEHSANVVSVTEYLRKAALPKPKPRVYTRTNPVVPSPRNAVLTVTQTRPVGDPAGRMETLGNTSIPIGHYEYCKKFKEDCAIVSRDTRPVYLTQERMDALNQVNNQVNNTLTQNTDQVLYGVEEHWTLPTTGAGDCEDLALLKRKLLLERGWPASSLLITVVEQPNGYGHAVLTVRTHRFDMVLDNLVRPVLPWNQTEYTYIKRVSAENSGQWVDIRDNRYLVASNS